MKFDDAVEREAWERYGKSVSPRDDPQGPLERAFSHGFRAGLEHACAARDREWAAAYVAPGGNPILGPQNPGELTEYLKGRDQALGEIEACKAIRKCKKICEGVALAHGDFKERHFANGARECAELIRALIGEDEDA